MPPPGPPPKRTPGGKPSFFDAEWDANDEDIRTAQEEEDNPDEGPKELEDGWRKVNFPSGNFYEGDILGGDMHGKGTLTYASGRIYVGEFQAHRLHGRGKMTEVDGGSYDGEWCLNKREGHGTHTSGKTKDVFVGEWEQNRMVRGKYTYADGRVYEGPFVNGTTKQGKGKMTQTNGDVYEGEFTDGKMTGKGTLTYRSGKVFVGQLINAKKIKGKFTSPDGSYYEGEFISEKPNGKGTRLNKDGDLYVGEWENGMMCGEGTMTFAEGKKFAKYVGQWWNNKYHGKGTVTFAESGKSLETQWNNGVSTEQFAVSPMGSPSGSPLGSPRPSPKGKNSPSPKGSPPPAGSPASSRQRSEALVSQPPKTDPVPSQPSKAAPEPKEPKAAAAVTEPTPAAPPPKAPTSSTKHVDPAATKSEEEASSPAKPTPVAAAPAPAQAKSTPSVAAAPPPTATGKEGATTTKAPPPKTSTTPATQSSTKRTYRERVERLLQYHDPAQLDTVDHLLSDAVGDEDQLIADLVDGLGPEPTDAQLAKKLEKPAASSAPPATKPNSASTTVDWKTRVTRFYLKYAPEKVPNVDTALRRYEGKEDELMEALVEKYGPEPATAGSSNVSGSNVSGQAAEPKPKPTFDTAMLEGASDQEDSSDEEGDGASLPQQPPAQPAKAKPTSRSKPPPGTHFAEAGEAIHKGYLSKFSIGKSFFGVSFGNWQKRFFVLDNRGLCYFRPEQMSDPAGICKIHNEGSRLVARPTPKTHKEVSLKQRHLQFVVVYFSDESGSMKEYKLLMKAETAEEKTAWVEAIESLVEEVDHPKDFPETT